MNGIEYMARLDEGDGFWATYHCDRHERPVVKALEEAP